MFRSFPCGNSHLGTFRSNNQSSHLGTSCWELDVLPDLFDCVLLLKQWAASAPADNARHGVSRMRRPPMRLSSSMRSVRRRGPNPRKQSRGLPYPPLASSMLVAHVKKVEDMLDAILYA